MDILTLPANLFTSEEREFIKSNRLLRRETRHPELKCSVYHILDENLEKVITTSEVGNRALALRIVSKAMQIRGKDDSVKAGLVACAAALGGWAPTEADRCLRSI